MNPFWFLSRQWLRRSLAIVIFCAFALGGRVALGDEFDYGPACQWIRLHGELPPAEVGDDVPALLSVNFRFSGMKRPSTLLVNYPLSGRKFKFLLAGLEEKIDHAILISPQIFFHKRVEFTYQARRADGKWSSGWRKVYYYPERIKKKGLVLCQTDLRLEF